MLGLEGQRGERVGWVLQIWVRNRSSSGFKIVTCPDPRTWADRGVYTKAVPWVEFTYLCYSRARWQQPQTTQVSVVVSPGSYPCDVLSLPFLSMGHAITSLSIHVMCYHFPFCPWDMLSLPFLSMWCTITSLSIHVMYYHFPFYPCDVLSLLF